MSVIDGTRFKHGWAVLDPIVSLRRRVRLARRDRRESPSQTLIASSRDEALALADEYNNPGNV